LPKEETDGLNAQINSLRNDVKSRDALLQEKERKITELQRSLEEARQTKTVTPQCDMQLQPRVLFSKGQSKIAKEQYAVIEQIADYMTQHPDTKIEIAGFASTEGSKQFNQKLSEKRAMAVKNALIKKYGISADRLTTVGYGATSDKSQNVAFNRIATIQKK
jgi:OmpA-OmpF porin, OOP family